MKEVSRRIAVIAAREVRRFVVMASMRAGRRPESIRGSCPSFRPLTEAETEAYLGGELLAALSGVRRQ